MSVQATLDGIARRLLREELEGDPVKTTARPHDGGFDGVSDDRPPLVHGEPLPVVHRDFKDTGAAA